MLAKDFFGRPQLKHPLFVVVEGDIDVVKSFKIDRFLNKRRVKKGKGQAIE